MSMNFECPNCHSDHAQRLALVWSAGLAKTESKNVSAGVGFLRRLPLKAMFMLVPVAAMFAPVAALYMLLKSAGSFIGGFASIGKSWGTSQSVLSAEAKPPYRFIVWRGLLQGLAFLFVAVFASAWASARYLFPHFNIPTHPNDIQIAAMLAAVFAPGLLITIAGMTLGIRYNLKVWPKREAVWQRSFQCSRCGTYYIQADFTPAGGNVVRSDRAGKGGLMPRFDRGDDKVAAEVMAEGDAQTLRKR